MIPAPRPSGNYTPKQQDSIRAYRLLCHAEFESFLEDRSIEIADAALQTFKAKNRTGHALASLMTFSPLSPQSPPASLGWNGIDRPINRVHRVVSQFKAMVSSGNHGIKEANVIAMLYPLGFTETNLDTTLLATLNSYGKNRGSTAHQAAHTQQPIDPVSEVKTVRWILTEFEALDATFSEKKKQSKL